mmetsp:Transcript_25886/g.64677  ORF Transcript_25886/g.64677 Transcript_25886/m.64677 type:complete len:150 (-) Transcript_25886:339-788(-)
MDFPKTDDGTPKCAWYSLVVFPGRSETLGIYNEKTSPDLCGCRQAPVYRYDVNEVNLDAAFPKIAALAGFCEDKKVSKGWIRYKDGLLRVCSGNARPPQKALIRGMKGTAFEGDDEFEPAEDAKVLTLEVKIESLHQLFCAAEGLLRSL